mmetsp:Transcript_19541/g.18658  ORF Transcript_19541/g.18658 Transcript_19541/m.18658 type:complete len:103 (+) Transcript_19541:1-309(+)
MIFSVGFYSFTIGNLEYIINEIETKNQELQAKINALNGFSIRNKLPELLVFKIRRFLENNSNHGQVTIHEQKLLIDELPSSLRAEVVQQTYSKVLSTIRFFD